MNHLDQDRPQRGNWLGLVFIYVLVFIMGWLFGYFHHFMASGGWPW